MKGYISVEVLCPQSHQMQRYMMINMEHIESIGDSVNGGVITTHNQVIITKEKYSDLIKIISDKIKL
jgi:hypothetical protein